ncbi:MAG: hypothetical protein BWY74_04529 [Firmicutes bacterium ADurb.Bin419]|nr:MAG: hypothetical protein BWY74_04529 [Firmicutes bacterium ADurb.Bin419]
MKKNIKLIIFIVLALLQLLVPSQMILSRELALRYGQEYKFRVEPLDPYDPFRGRYLYINVEDTEITVNNDQQYHSNQTIYVLIENDTSGFARFSGIMLTPPESGTYIKTKISYITYEHYNGDGSSGESTVHFQAPFDRYYMPEKEAPSAEKIYNEKLSQDSTEDVYVTVKIYKGKAVLDKLFIGDKTIEEYMKQ